MIEIMMGKQIILKQYIVNAGLVNTKSCRLTSYRLFLPHVDVHVCVDFYDVILLSVLYTLIHHSLPADDSRKNRP